MHCWVRDWVTSESVGLKQEDCCGLKFSPNYRMGPYLKKKSRGVWWFGWDVPHSLWHLNPWFPIDGTIWEGLGYGLAEESTSLRAALRFQKPGTIPNWVSLSLLLAVLRYELSAVPATFPCCHGDGLLSLWNPNPKGNQFFLLSCLAHGVLPQH